MTASASSANSSHEYVAVRRRVAVAVAAEVERPHPAARARPASAATGAQTRPWKPVGCASSTASPCAAPVVHDEPTPEGARSDWEIGAASRHGAPSWHSCPETEAAVAAANAAYYAAFEARDLDPMAEVWERSDRGRGDAPGLADAARLGARSRARGTRSSPTPRSSSSCSPTRRCTSRARRPGSRATRTSCRRAARARAVKTSPSSRAGSSPRPTCSCTTTGAGGWCCTTAHRSRPASPTPTAEGDGD